jgi:hypothetical protein
MVVAMEDRTTTTTAIVRSIMEDFLWKLEVTPAGGGPHGMVHGSTPGGMAAIATTPMFDRETNATARLYLSWAHANGS